MKAQTRRLWLIPVGAALVYPWLLRLFHGAMMTVDQSASAAPAAALAALALAGTFAVPLIAFLVIRRLMAHDRELDRRALRVAHLAFATPPLFTAIGLAMSMLNVREHELVVWNALWLGLTGAALLIPRRPPGPAAQQPTRRPSRARVAHGVMALVVLLIFLIGHLGNHVVGLLGAEAHGRVMQVLRVVYRATWVEPILLLLLVLLAITGLGLVIAHTAVRQDIYRSAQTASGVYIAAFLVPHCIAVLVVARVILGIETDWAFASSMPTGLLYSAFGVRLIPYYALAVFLVITHVGLGTRNVLREHGVGDAMGRRVVVAAIVVGVATALAITVALCRVERPGPATSSMTVAPMSMYAANHVHCGRGC